MNPSNYREDEISLADLFYYLLKRWRSLLAALLVGFALGGAAAVQRSAPAGLYEPGAADRLKIEQAYQYQLLYEQQMACNEETFALWALAGYDAGDPVLLAAKSEAISAAAALQEQLNEALDDLNSDQKAYYNEQYRGIPRAQSGGLTAGSLVKWLVMGALAAGVCWGIVWSLAYLTNSTVQQVDTLVTRGGLPFMGRVEPAPAKARGLDACIRRWEAQRKPAPCTAEYLASALALLPAEEIVLCRTSADPASAALVEELGARSAKPVHAGSLHTDAQTLRRGKAAGGVVLLVALGRTPVEELKAELRACRLYDLRILGVIAIG